MVVATLLPQHPPSTLADLDLPASWHHAATGDNTDTAGGFHWVGLLILLLKLLPFVLAIAGIIYRKTRRGAASTPSAYAPNRTVIAPWQPALTQPAGGYTPHSQPVAPWPSAPSTRAGRQSPSAAAWQAVPPYPAAPALAASAPAPYEPALYR
jgi:hypothetical protein